MDVSKLPRLSKTDTVGSDSAAPGDSPASGLTQPPVVRSRIDAAGIGAEVWVIAILGLIFLALGRSFGSYAIATMTHHPYHTNVNWQEGPQAGNEVPYRDLDASFGLPIYSDSGLFLFGLSLVLAAVCQVITITRYRGGRVFGWIALVIVLAATVYNVFVSIKLFSADITPILSLICVALGGFEVMLQYGYQRRVISA